MDYMNYPEDFEKEKKGGFRIKFLLAALIILIIAIAAGAVILINTGVKTQRYNSAITFGNSYYNAGDYENAIIQYELAISIDDKRTAGYLNLSSAYIVLGDYASAEQILQRGIEHSADPALEERLSQIQALTDTKTQMETVSNMTEDEIRAISNNVTVENTYFDMIAAYTYTEYYRDYGTPVNATAENGIISFYYDAVGMTTVYYDMENEKVLDSSNRMPIAITKPCKVSFAGLDKLFSKSNEVFVISYERLKELLGGSGELKYDSVNNRYYVTAEYKYCRISVQTDEKGNVVSINAWNELEPVNRGSFIENEKSDGSISGYIQDAVTGRGMAANIKVRNRGMRTGNTIAELKSKTDGSYTFEGLKGTYTLEISAIGYVTEYLDVEIIMGQTQMGKNVNLIPVLSEGEMRIVLSWGSYPSDLDSHASGRTSQGSNFHIFFSNKSTQAGVLDVDDTNGYGPETITITDPGADFTYSVVDFIQSGNMSSSGAVVKVYLPDGTMQSFNIPSGNGNTWTVFSYSNGQITLINTIS